MCHTLLWCAMPIRSGWCPHSLVMTRKGRRNSIWHWINFRYFKYENIPDPAKWNIIIWSTPPFQVYGWTPMLKRPNERGGTLTSRSISFGTRQSSVLINLISARSSRCRLRGEIRCAFSCNLSLPVPVPVYFFTFYLEDSFTQVSILLRLTKGGIPWVSKK